MTRLASLTAAVLLTFAAASAPALDWSAHASADTVVIATTDEGGAARDTTIWLCVSNGQGYVRGGGGQWVANALRDGAVTLRVGDAHLALTATRVTDAAEIERVTADFRAKYGFSDTLATLIRGEPTIFRLTPR
ncbi:MAG: DUF2255 family protein [Deltaproteobacteria bacterium]|nr:DUF2255 family protein [Deltaproteobacteria bacterium]